MVWYKNRWVWRTSLTASYALKLAAEHRRSHRKALGMRSTALQAGKPIPTAELLDDQGMPSTRGCPHIVTAGMAEKVSFGNWCRKGLTWQQDVKWAVQALHSFSTSKLVVLQNHRNAAVFMATTLVVDIDAQRRQLRNQ